MSCCPICGQPLRYGDGHDDPLLFCRECGIGWMGATPTVAEIEGALRVRNELLAQGCWIVSDAAVGRAS